MDIIPRQAYMMMIREGGFLNLKHSTEDTLGDGKPPALREPSATIPRTMLPVYFSVFLVSLGMGMTAYFIPIFAQTFSATFVDLGVISSAFATIYALTPLAVGYLSDRFGRGWMFAVAIILNALTSILLIASRTVTDVIIFRALAGFSTGFFWPTASALVIDLAPDERRTKYIGFYSVVWVSAFLIGPLLAGFIIEALGFTSLFITATAITAIAIVPDILLIHPRYHFTGGTQRFPFRENLSLMKGIFPWYVFSTLYGIVFSVMSTFIPAYANIVGITPAMIGILFAVFGVARITIFTTSNRWSSFDEKRALLSVSCLIPFCFVILGVYSNFTGFCVSMILLGGCVGLIYPIAFGMISRHFPSERAGFAAGSYEATYGAGYVIGPLLGGIIAALTDTRTMLLLTSIFGILMAMTVGLGRTETTSVES